MRVPSTGTVSRKWRAHRSLIEFVKIEDSSVPGSLGPKKWPLGLPALPRKAAPSPPHPVVKITVLRFDQKPTRRITSVEPVNRHPS